MNKLLLNNSARNHIKIFPMADTVTDLPESDADRILWCRERFNALQNDTDAHRLIIYKNKFKGYLISVWESKGLCYLIQCIRNEFGTYNDVIWISKDKDDCIAIAKFIRDNIETIMADYREQIIEARDALITDVVDDNAA